MEALRLIVGLGNPGREYAATRHNAGFMVAERLAERWRAGWRMESKFNARLARGEFKGAAVLLCQPQTYMNRSGEAVAAVSGFYQISTSNTLVCVDDADLKLGEIRLRPSGSSGGHHGLLSVENYLGTREYARQRLGIGRRDPSVREITGHVLGRFSGEEAGILDAVLDRAACQVECWVTAGVQKAMNQFNGAAIAPLSKDR